MRWLRSRRCISIIAMGPRWSIIHIFIIALRHTAQKRVVRDMVARMVVGMRVDMAMVIELSGCKKNILSADGLRHADGVGCGSFLVGDTFIYYWTLVIKSRLFA
jgi:hypothetical protein